MKVIHKYPFQVNDVVRIVMPSDAKVLHIQEQRDVPCMWAIHDAYSVADTEFVFRIFGTGHPIDNDKSMMYIGTFLSFGGELVWHVFELPSFRTAVSASKVQQLECA